MADGGGLKTVSAGEVVGGQFRYYDFVMAAFVAIILLSNVLGAGKVAVVNLPGIGLWPFGAGILFFPISYVIGDVLTEVYGYARARRVIWAGFSRSPSWRSCPGSSSRCRHRPTGRTRRRMR